MYGMYRKHGVDKFISFFHYLLLLFLQEQGRSIYAEHANVIVKSRGGRSAAFDNANYFSRNPAPPRLGQRGSS